MRSITQWLTGSVMLGIAFASVFWTPQVAQATDSVVPKFWGVAPITSGAYLEGFEDSTLPTWAQGGYNAFSNVSSFGESTLPVRSNIWFATHSKALRLDTDSTVITNTLVHDDESDVSFTSEPVFVDMRVKLEAVTEPPESEIVGDAKMALYVEPNGKLVVIHGGGAFTNSEALDITKWHQVTIKLYGETKFDVRINDTPLVSDLTLKAGGSSNILEAINFRGTGLLDDLYVSRCDPNYEVTGPTTALAVTLPAAGGNPPSAHEQTLVNLWLNGQSTMTSLKAGTTQDELSVAYLLDAMSIDSNVGSVPESYRFGISRVDLNPPSTLIVTMALKVNAADKSGPINGRVQIYGKTSLTADLVAIGDPLEPTFDANGESTHTVEISSSGYRFFEAKIIP